jgi:hypothetical protein
MLSLRCRYEEEDGSGVISTLSLLVEYVIMLTAYRCPALTGGKNRDDQ